MFSADESQTFTLSPSLFWFLGVNWVFFKRDKCEGQEKERQLPAHGKIELILQISKTNKGRYHSSISLCDQIRGYEDGGLRHSSTGSQITFWNIPSCQHINLPHTHTQTLFTHNGVLIIYCIFGPFQVRNLGIGENLIGGCSKKITRQPGTSWQQPAGQMSALHMQTLMVKWGAAGEADSRSHELTRESATGVQRWESWGNLADTWATLSPRIL